MKHLKILILVVFVLSITERNQAQIKVDNKNDAGKIKDSTKVVVPDSQRDVLVAKPFFRGDSGKNRAIQTFPVPKHKNVVEGIVVVEVIVDREGKVTKATPGVKGTTTMDEKLWEAAKNAALLARFDRKTDGPEYQKGTITYKFRLQ